MSADLSSLVDAETNEPVAPTQYVQLKKGNLAGLEVRSVADTPDNFNMLIYGHSGVGKTRLAGSASLIETMKPVLFIDVEGGTYSIRDLYPEVDVVRVQNFRELQSVYEELYTGQSGYNTVVIDSLTEMQKFSMYGIMQDLIKKEPDRDPDIPSVREWGKNIEQIRKMVRAFRDLTTINTIFTALVSEDKNAKTGAVEKKPYLSGKLAHEVAGFLDIVLYMYIKPVDGVNERLVCSQKTEDVVAKDRSDKLPPVLLNPIMNDIVGYMTGQTNKEQTQ